jgi:uncharacterized RDD family membrane protein YckC
MSTIKKLGMAAFLSAIAWISVALVVAQGVRIERDPFFRIGGPNVVRLWQDFVLREGESSRDVVVVSGNATIAGEVDGDVVDVLGSVKIDRTAVIHGSVVVVAGNATVDDGAVVRRDLMVYGGSSFVPAAFSPGGQHIIVGNSWMGDQVRSLVPWVTHGLLWGRLIVPSLGWIWGVMAMVLIVTLAINLLLHRAVGQCADAIAARPASTFLTGLLMLLLTGPIAVLLAATVIGLAIVPFFVCAVVVAWIAGKVGVSRWIGRSILGHGSDETQLQAMIAVVLGFAGVCLLYMVPIVGIVTWALAGVFGLGSASLTVMGALRRERPPAPPKAPGVREASVPLETPFQAVPPVEPYATAAPEPPPAPPSPPPSGLALMPRATFIQRLAAGALDVLLVLFVFNMFLDHLFWFRHDVDGQMFLLLAYFIVFWSWKGTTLGGIVCHLRVTRTDGRPLAGSDAIIRGLASLFSFVPLGIGFFWILRDPQQQAWHDKIAGTYVVKVPKDWPV